MEKEWNKAVEKLIEISGDKSTYLRAEIWPTNMGDPYNSLQYSASAVFELYGINGLKCISSESFKTPMEAVDNLIIKISKYEEEVSND